MPTTAYVTLSPLDLTSATSHSPFVVASDGSDIWANWESFRASSLWTSRGWLKNVATAGWLRLDFGTATAVDFYTVAGAGFQVTTSSPKDWTFEGSPDGTSWTVLDTRAGVAWTSPYEERRYPLSASATYRYFRLNCSANNGGGYVGMSRFTMGISGTIGGSGGSASRGLMSGDVL